MRKRINIFKNLGYLALATMVVASLTACGSSSSSTPAVPAVPAVPIAPTILVTDTAGVVVEGATVYAIPAAAVAEIAAVPLTLTAGNYDVAALAADEPLEDLVNGNFTPSAGAGGGVYVQATTNATGKAVLTGLPVGASDLYFIYVAPALADTGRLPGGSLCRNTVTGASLDNTVTAVEVSTTPSVTATYIGSSACLGCHATYTTQTQTAHRHGIMVAGSPGTLQDVAAEFGATSGVYEYMAGLNLFTAGDAASGGTTVWFYAFDPSRGFDKFRTLTTDPGVGAASVANPAGAYATVRAYIEGGVYKMQFTNIANPGDPVITREALMNYGGGVYKQRYLTSFGASESLYMLPLQYNASGDDAAADRTRKVFRDYHLDFWMNGLGTVATPADPAISTFRSLPLASKSFDINCASCHFTDYTVTKNGATGEYSASGTTVTAGGEIHPITGLQQELNVGCETCHGPGSEHSAAAGMGVAIVTPANLSTERVSIICGQCHSRPQGIVNTFSVANDQPVDFAGKMMRPGTSRADYLANNTSRHDATTSDMWADGLHSKSHHQQYTDFISSVKYRNGSALKTCTDCHDVHAPGTDRHQLSGTTNNSLCISCHAAKSDVVAHMITKTGASMGASTKCIDCHFTKTAKSGAGETTGKVGGTSSVTYYQNDISSHRLDVPLQTDTSSTNAMPVPYINKCGSCHGTGMANL